MGINVHPDDRQSPILNLIQGSADWLVDKSQIRSEGEEFDNPAGYRHSSFVGSFKTEYDTSTGRWWLNGPAFHTGQAIRSLLVAWRQFEDPRYLAAARLAGSFLNREVIDESGHPQNGLLLSFEQNDDEINLQVTFEALSGLLDLYLVTDDAETLRTITTSVEILFRDAYLPEERLMLDHYSTGRRVFFHDPDNMLPGRAMIDDAFLVRLADVTGDERYRTWFLEMARRLAGEEGPAGTWLRLPPWPPERRRIHNRKNWWWGWPMLAAHDLTGEQAFLDLAIRTGDWWLESQNLDGGLYYSPGPDGRHNSFGLCTSVSAVAALQWIDLWERTGDDRYPPAVRKSMGYLLAAQFGVDAGDPNVVGALFESPKAPNGRICPGYLVRDLAPIFAIRAAAAVLHHPNLFPKDESWIDTSMNW